MTQTFLHKCVIDNKIKHLLDKFEDILTKILSLSEDVGNSNKIKGGNRIMV